MGQHNGWNSYYRTGPQSRLFLGAGSRVMCSGAQSETAMIPAKGGLAVNDRRAVVWRTSAFEVRGSSLPGNYCGEDTAAKKSLRRGWILAMVTECSQPAKSLPWAC